MIILKNKHPSLEDFGLLVERATALLNKEAAEKQDYYLTRNAQKLEDDVFRALQIVAKDTPFADTINKVSGQRFPDIVAGKYFGVEVKSSKDENWTTLGGSVNESTRVQDVERIFLIFGKLTSPVEFKSRPYQDCLSEVVVTHYPRYKIDMNLKSNETIFDKMGTDYDTLRTKENPTKEIINYYKKTLKHGERLWWFDEDNATTNATHSNSATVRLWNTLTPAEKDYLKINAYILFPEIVGNSATKYDNLALWLVTNHGIASPALRDSFSAGGRVKMSIGDKDTLVPRVIYNIYENRNKIKAQLALIPDDVLKEFWNAGNVCKNRFEQWLSLLCKNAPEQEEALNYIMR